MDYNKLLQHAKEGAAKAAEAILAIYRSGDFSIEAKADNSPLTKADKAAHHAIVEELEKTGLPILSEEGRDIPFEERKNWEYFWMIDPLDGTKEFIKKNGEFTVNIALIHQSKPILGVVHIPVTGKMYFALAGQGAHAVDNGIEKNIHSRDCKFSDFGLKVVASRSHLNDETQDFLRQLNQPEIVSMGSSLKLLAVAEGTADVYPRFAPTMEWDTAAAQIIVEEAGAQVTIKDSSDNVGYNKAELLNPYFLVSGNNFQ